MSEILWVISICATCGVIAGCIKWKYNLSDKIVYSVSIVLGAIIGVVVGIIM